MEIVEAKRKQPRVAEVSKRRASSFVRDLREEVKKITWTSQPELVFCTKLVVGTTFAFGLGIYLVDLLVKGGIDLINATIRFVFG